MRSLFFTPLLAIAAACSGGASVDPVGEDSDSDAIVQDDSDPILDTEVDTDDTGGAVLSAYPGGRYIVTELRILNSGLGLDLDGDGTVDNNLPGLLTAADLVLGGNGFYGVQATNARIDAILDAEATIVLLDITHELGVLEIALLRAVRDTDGNLQVLPENYDGLGEPLQKFVGRFKSDVRCEAGPGQVTLPFQFDPDEPEIEITAVDARIGGDLDVFAFNGAIGGAFPIDIVLNDVVNPLIVDNVPTSDQERILTLVEGAVTAAADVQAGGGPAISGAFSIKAEPATW
jgi:hypothetical protein